MFSFASKKKWNEKLDISYPKSLLIENIGLE